MSMDEAGSGYPLEQQNLPPVDGSGETKRQMFTKMPEPDPELLVLLEEEKGPVPTPSVEDDGQQKMCVDVNRDNCHLAVNGRSHEVRPVAGPDREVWVRDQVVNAIRMALALQAQRGVRANTSAFEHGIRGIAEGATVEILGTLGFDLHQLVNINRIHVPDTYC